MDDKKRNFQQASPEKCPELKFIADDSIEHSAEIAKMLENIAEAENEEETQSEDE